MAGQEDDEFEEQLRQEELARLSKEEGATLSKGTSYVDEDGTVMEWDHERKAYFPKIDADFIAQYQISYGAGTGAGDGEMTEEQKKAQYDEYWQNYYKVYSQQQPQMPKFDEEGNAIEGEDEEEEEDAEDEGGKKSDKKKKSSKKKDNNSQQSESSNTQQQTVDPTSEEHYQYNLYYYGKEYADAYREYYQEHPDSELLPDWINESGGRIEQSKKEQEKKKKKSDKGEKRKEPERDEGWFEASSETSAQVYVSGLPSNTTEEEYKDLMSKCGLIMFDPLTRQPKLKLYKDADGKLKGDGLCTYIKSESVALALQILDGSEFKDHTIHVEKAKFELKGDFDPKKKKKKLNNKQKQKLKERQEKLFDWRPDKNPFERSKHERIVILKHMFDIREFERSPALINEIRNDVREECAKFGDVRKVTLYDRNPEGVVSVAFKEPEEADACIAALNGRWFAGQQIVAATFDGKTKYDVQETEEERQKRLKEWDDFLSGTNDAKPGAGKGAANAGSSNSSTSSSSSSSSSGGSSAPADPSTAGDAPAERPGEATSAS